MVLAIMDGVGIGKYPAGDAVRTTPTPQLDWLAQHALTNRLKATGARSACLRRRHRQRSRHNACIGCGRVFDQGAMLSECRH